MKFSDLPFGVLCTGRRIDGTFVAFMRVRDGREHNQVFVTGEANGVLLSLKEAQLNPDSNDYSVS